MATLSWRALLLGLSLAGIAVGFVMWANHLMPRGPFVDDRHDPTSGEDELEEVEADVERGGILTRRKLILRTLGLAVGGSGRGRPVPDPLPRP